MRSSKNQIIIDIIGDLETEKNDLLRKIQNNLDHILEEKKYVKSMSDQEDVDYKVFSPRSYKNQYQHEIEETHNSIHAMEEENRRFYSSCNQIDLKLDKLKFLLNGNKANAVINMKDRQPLNHAISNIQSLDSNLITELIQNQEAERRKQANSLNDSLQELVMVLHKLEQCGKYTDADIVRLKLDIVSIQKKIQKIMKDLSSEIFSISPISFDGSSFFEALTRIPEKLKHETDCCIDIQYDNFYIQDEEVLIALYRILFECIYRCVQCESVKKIELHIFKKDHEIDSIIEGYSMDTDRNWIMMAKPFHKNQFLLLIKLIELTGGSIIFTDNSILIKVLLKEGAIND